MTVPVLILSGLGAFAFGLVVGWVTYRTLRRNTSNGLSDIASVIGAVGGAAVTALFPQETGAFGAYCLGLALGFFAYLRTAMNIAKDMDKPESVADWLGEEPGIARQDASGTGRRKPGVAGE